MSGVWVPPGKQTFTDPLTGKPLQFGTLRHYVPATTTDKLTWSDQALTVANPAIITLDDSGQCIIWGDGLYRQVLKDEHGVQIWDQVTGFLGGGGGSETGVPTRAVAITTMFPADLLFLQTSGYYAAGDLGGANYRRVATAPAHVGWFQSADGAYWEICEAVVNVHMLGAHGDAILLTNGATTNGSHTFTSASANFLTADVGKMIEVLGAGPAGAGLTTFIASVNGPTSVEMLDAAGTTVAGARTWYGTNDVSHIIAAWTYINVLKSGVLTLLPGRNYQMHLGGFGNGDAMVVISNALGFTFDFNGGKLIGLYDFSIGFPGTTHSIYGIALLASSNVQILNGFCEFYPDTTGNAFLYGMGFIIGFGNYNFTFNTLQFGGRMGLWLTQNAGDPFSVISRNIRVDITSFSCAYPLALYETVGVRGSVIADDCERVIFLVNAKDCLFDVAVSNAKAEGVLIVAENSDQRLTAGVEDIQVNVYNPGRSSTLAPGMGLQHVIRTDGVKGGARSRNVGFDVTINLDGTPGETGGLALTRQIETAVGSGAYVADTGPARGHIIERLRFGGVMTGMTAARSIAQIALGWPAGEFISGFALDIVAEGASGQINIDGAALVNPMSFNLYAPNMLLDFRNVTPLFAGMQRVTAFGVSSGFRPVLTASMTIIVDAGGNDGFAGLTLATAKRTLQGAIDAAYSYDLGGHTIVIQLNDSGSPYAPAMLNGAFVGSVGANGILIRGNVGTPANTQIAASGTADCISGSGGAEFTIQGLSFQNTGTGAFVRVGGFGTLCVNAGGTPFANGSIGGESPTEVNGILT